MKYAQRLIDVFDKPEYPVFTINDVKLVLKGRGLGADYLYLMLHNLLSKKKITRITSGVYTFHDDAAVAGFAFAPFYYGLESAFWLRGISGQGANYVIMTPRNVRIGIRCYQGRNYRVQKIRKEKLFGYSLVKYGAFWIPVSDVEKTLIDMVYFGNYISDELWPDIMEQLDRKKLTTYLKAYKSNFRKKLLNILGQRSNSRDAN